MSGDAYRDEGAVRAENDILKTKLRQKDEEIKELKNKMNGEKRQRVRSWFSKYWRWLYRIPAIVGGLLLCLYLFELNDVYEADGRIKNVKQVKYIEDVCESKTDKQGKVYADNCKEVVRINKNKPSIITIKYKNFRGNVVEEVYAEDEDFSWSFFVPAHLKRKYGLTVNERGGTFQNFDKIKVGDKIKVLYLVGSVFKDYSWCDPIVVKVK